MTKKLMSVVAMATILGTGAQAFDTNPAGDILTRTGLAGNYENGLQSNGLLVRSTDVVDRLKGDALIFPAFDMKDGWNTEITVRNNLHERSVVGKVVLYAADDSRELIDFNIYLSHDDQFKFLIGDGKVYSEDGSVVVNENLVNDTVTFASPASPFTRAVTDPITGKVVEEGYTIVYGMMETPNGHHHDHAGIFLDYRQALDAQRPGWRTNHMTLGVYDDAINATEAPNVPETQHAFDVDPNAISGIERMYNATGETRDLLLNPTALENFTDGNIIIWGPGEYAAIADRKIEDLGAGSIYDAAEVRSDSNTFIVNSTTYIYNNANGGVDNKFLLLQPTKRFLVQLGFGPDFWVQACDDTSPDSANIVTGLEWGFRGQLGIFNENEDEYSASIGGGIITSPNSSSSQDAHCLELTTLTNLEDEAPEFADGNGFVDFDLTTGNFQGMPAIITQMAAARVGGNGEINWVYSPASKN